MAFLTKKNNAKTTLTEDIAIGETAWDVADATLLDDTPDFVVTCWDRTTYRDPEDDPNMEIARVTGIVGNTLTVTKNQEGTGDNAHSSGDTVAMLITAGTLDEAFDQDLKISDSPTFENLTTTSTVTWTGGSSTATNSHLADNSQAHSDYLINNGNDTTSGSLTAQAGLRAGAADTTVGLIIAFGGSANAGGSLQLQLGATVDGTINTYVIDSFLDDLRIFPNTASFIHYFRAEGGVEFAQDVSVGDALTTGGFISSYTTVTASTDALDVTDKMNFAFDVGGSPIVIGGLTGGVTGQIVNFFSVDASAFSSVTFEHNEASGTEKLLNHTGANIVWVTAWQGVSYIKHANGFWYNISNT